MSKNQFDLPEKFPLKSGRVTTAAAFDGLLHLDHKTS